MPVGDRTDRGFLWVLARTWHGVKVRRRLHINWSFLTEAECLFLYVHARASGWKTGSLDSDAPPSRQRGSCECREAPGGRNDSCPSVFRSATIIDPRRQYYERSEAFGGNSQR